MTKQANVNEITRETLCFEGVTAGLAKSTHYIDMRRCV